MRIPMKVDYGVRALVDLAQFTADGPVRTADVARRQHIPEPYLDQVLTTLNKFGFIRSRRGPRGGHLLARDPHDIPLSEVVATLEGRIAPLDCIADQDDCVLSGSCTQREIWRGVEDAVQRVLEATTVWELAFPRQPVAGPL
ncbi:MAG: Rrf2 family transcriptional regulator [Dehalococcoidia bacterium]|nr:Rrf2 family transcriptional regulator [Dehalococcoidia bacterium]